MAIGRRLPVGAEVIGAGVDFSVWAPQRTRIEVVIENGTVAPLELKRNSGGYFAGTVAALRDGTRYRYRIDGSADLLPDPASRYQPEGPHGPSQVVDPTRFEWTDAAWKGCKLEGQVLYEMHIGTFTKVGTFAAAMAELPELAGAGITCIEVMPVAEFPGEFGWGYDGVNLFAPTRLYGEPDDFRRFVNRAHALGVGVILDVVYNHLGPDGNYLGKFTESYFTDDYKTDWGKAINFHSAGCEGVREFYTSNAGYWIDEFHLDGLRLDATQNIYDSSPPEKHILTDIGRAVRLAAKGRSVFVVNENEAQQSELVRPIEKGGYGLDALWNDDFHHSALVALTGRNEAYYTDYRGDSQEFISCAKYGYLYQGQWYAWQKQNRGTPALDLPPAAFVTFIENHDQIANSGRGLRPHRLTSPARYRAVLALLLLSPGTPMLFQGQEFGASAPFFYFADHKPDLAKLVSAGRVEFLSQFRSLADPQMEKIFAKPDDPATFERCKLDLTEREKNAPQYRLVKDLLKLRRDDPAFRAQKWRGVDGSLIGSGAFVLRFSQDDGADRLLIVNLGRDLHLERVADPLLAPPAGCAWHMAFSTEDPAYGGMGIAPIKAPDEGWRIAGESASVLIPQRAGSKTDAESIGK
jgi:maltooligosyltrehalose trehalohydrolase